MKKRPVIMTSSIKSSRKINSTKHRTLSVINNDDICLIDTIMLSVQPDMLENINLCNFTNEGFKVKRFGNYEIIKNVYAFNHITIELNEKKWITLSNLISANPRIITTCSVHFSLPKFINNGDNSDCINIGQALKAVNDISEIIGFNILECKVYRIDLAYTFDLKTNLNDVLRNLHPANNQDLIRKDSRYFPTVYWHFKKDKYITIAFYDKMQESLMKERDNPLIEVDKSKNLLRFEVQFYDRCINELFFPTTVTLECIIKSISKLNDFWTDVICFFEVKSDADLTKEDLTEAKKRQILLARYTGYDQKIEEYIVKQRSGLLAPRTSYDYRHCLEEHEHIIRNLEFENVKKISKNLPISKSMKS